jgi:hypothetical protein
MQFSAGRWGLCALIIAGCSGFAHAAEPAPCSNQTLRGDYAFTLTGQILAPAPAAGPVAGVAWTHFDGNGNMNQVDHVLHNGVAPIEDWRPGVGPYQVNSDCTGYFTINPMPTNPADAGPVLQLFFVLANDGHEIRTVVSNSPSTPAFTVEITSIGTRIR